MMYHIPDISCKHALSHLILLRDKQQRYESDTEVIYPILHMWKLRLRKGK